MDLMDLEHLNVAELKVVAKYYKLEGTKNMRRHELITLLVSHLNKHVNINVPRLNVSRDLSSNFILTYEDLECLEFSNNNIYNVNI